MAAAEKQPTTPLVNYVEGDATAPVGDGLKIIAHCCNNVGAWGAGFVVALSKQWMRPEIEYRKWHRERKQRGDNELPLGAMQLVPVESDIYVANIIGQRGIRTAKGGVPPIRYEAIEKGFRYIAQFATAHPERNVSVHAPRLGCGLAGASWSKIEPLLDRYFVLHGIPVTIYDLPGSSFNP